MQTCDSCVEAHFKKYEPMRAEVPPGSQELGIAHKYSFQHWVTTPPIPTGFHPEAQGWRAAP
ncbi:MAG: hypothetical protein ACI9OD_000814 [Limisphaerales bacterium]|jgi:hypothetical protein